MSRRQATLAGFCVFCAAMWFAPTNARADWPQFLGPHRNAMAPEAKGLAKSWPMEGPKEVWRTSVSRGFGGAAIGGDRVIFMDREGTARDVVRCLRLSDGEELWRYAYDAPGRLSFPGSRTTPATDGELVFTVGGFGHVHALDLAAGKPKWKAHLLEDWEAKLPHWGVATSSLLLSKAVVFAPWGRRAALVAYDKKSGRVLWTTPNRRNKKLAYASPTPMKLKGKTMIVAIGAGGYTIGVDARTGEELWSYSGYSCSIQIPSPVVLGRGRLMLTGGYGAGSAVIQVQSVGGRYRVKEVWRNRAIGSTLAQPVVYRGYIYLNSGFKNKEFGLACLSSTGRVLWDTDRSPNFDMGPVLLLGKTLLAVDGKSGDLVMVSPSPRKYKEAARASVLKGPVAWAPMAFSDGRLVLRDRRNVVCLDLRAR